MARRVFFSFHYQNDIWRASQVRKSWVTKDKEANTFLDAASWESVKKEGDTAIKRWINEQMKGTSVTVVLIGNQTWQRKYVLYEIERSVDRGNGILGINIHGLKNSQGLLSLPGINPLSRLWYEEDPPFGIGLKIRKHLSDVYKTYDWVTNNGYKNIDLWIEAAAKAVGR